MRLVGDCRKEALRNPCQDEARKIAEEKCKNITGMGRGNCMNYHFEQQLAIKCRDVVCPGDQFAVEEGVMRQGSSTTMLRADQGGGFTTADQNFVLTQGSESGDREKASGGGTSPDKMKVYLALGVGVVVLLSLTMGKKK